MARLRSVTCRLGSAVTFPVEVTPKPSSNRTVCLACLPHLPLCLLTFLLTSVPFLPREPLSPPSCQSIPLHLCTVQRSVEIQPELPQHHVSPVLLLLAGPMAHAQHPTGTAWIPTLCSAGWYHHVLGDHTALPSVLSIFQAEVPGRPTLKVAWVFSYKVVPQTSSLAPCMYPNPSD